MELIKRTLLRNCFKKEMSVRFTNKRYFIYITKPVMDAVGHKTQFIAFKDENKLILKFDNFEDVPDFENNMRKLSIARANGKSPGGANATMKDVMEACNVKDGTYRAEVPDPNTIVIDFNKRMKPERPSRG